MPISNVSGYVVNVYQTIPDAPSINVDLINADEEAVSSACEEYLVNASAYASVYAVNASDCKDYVLDRFVYDLTDGNAGLAIVNKQENTVSLHEKADDAFNALRKNYNLLSFEGASAFAAAFTEFCQTHYMNDDKTSCILLTGSEYYTVQDGGYDEKAITIDAATMNEVTSGDISGSAIFINEIPNKAGTNEATYATYISDGGDNVAAYEVVYNSAYSVGDSSISVWEMKVAGESGATIAYTEDAFGPEAEWTAAEAAPAEEPAEESSSSEEPVESSSSEEPAEEPSESSEEPVVEESSESSEEPEESSDSSEEGE